MKNKSPLLALGFFMLSSFQLEAQNDSVKINATIDTITIGNMIIIKKQGENNNYNSNNRKNHKTYGTIINITNGKYKKILF